jgi:hypothetical protein
MKVTAWSPRISGALLLLAGGCFETPEFAPESLVDRPRILAIVADPPEVTPGTAVGLSVMVGGAEVDEVRWSACGTFASFAASTQYGENSGDQGCSEGPLFIGNGQRVRLDTISTLALFEDDARVQSALGAQLPAETLTTIRDGVGVAFSIEADVAVGGKHLRGLKHVLLSMRETPNKNPPPPAFMFNDTKIGPGPEPFTCAAVSGEVAQAAPGTKVALRPSVGSLGAETWLEKYPVLDARGNTVERTEQAFYAWFAPVGKMQRRETHDPERDNTWELPNAPACTRMWLVVRDGHGGISACMLRVQIGEASGCDTAK